MIDDSRAETRVKIPVEFFATYDHEAEKITKLVVMPLESYAGYFGPPSQVWDGKHMEVRDTDGEFWRAMQGALGRVAIEWEE